MTKHQKISVDSANSREAVSRFSLFGPPPLLEGEDFAAYDELLARVSGGVNPADTIEDIWVREVVDLTWEIFRWRRVKADLITQAMPDVLEGLLAPHFRMRSFEDEYGNITEELPQSLYKLVKKWTAGDPAAISKVEKLLASAKLTVETVVHRALANTIEEIEHFDRLITTLESRRNAIWREIDRRRALFAQTLRGKVRDIEAAEFETVKPNGIESKTVANKNAE